MDLVTVSCPSCGLSRQLPAGRVPDDPCRATCPRCRCSFPYTIPAPVPAPPVPAGQQRRPAPRKLRAVRHWELSRLPVLVRESWEVFRRRFYTLAGLFLLSLAGFAAPAAAAAATILAAGMERGALAAAAVRLAGTAGGLCLGFRVFAGFLLAVADEGLSMNGALARGRDVAAGVAWVTFLSGCVMAGGFMLFVVPGIIFAVWFSFAQFVLVREDYRGMDALLKSKEYIRGEWGKVALRLLLVWSASLVLAAVPVAGPFLAILFFPYLAIFHYLIYRDLREMKGELPFPCGTVDEVK